MASGIKDKVVILGMGCSKFGERWDCNAQDLMVEAFGDAGRHARSAVGVYKLPLGFAVEVDAVVEVK